MTIDPTPTALSRRAWLAAPLISMLLALAAPAFAQPARQADPLLTRCVLRAPDMDRAVIRADLPFRGSRDTTLLFDLVLPPTPPAPTGLPLVIFYDAGSNWNPPLRRWGIYRDWGRLLATRGIASVFYDPSPGTVTDAESLLVFLRREAATFHLDPDRVAMWMCSMHVREGLPFAMDPAHRIRAAVAYYGVTDTAAMNPDVPALLARAGIDNPQIVGAMGAWATKAVRQGAPLTWIDLPTLHHAFDAFEDDPLSRAVVRQTLDFLEQELSPEGIAARASNADERLTKRLIRESRWAEAASTSQKWLASQPESPDAHRALADASYHLDKFPVAAVHYQKAGDLGQQPALTWYNAACCRARLGQKKKALELLEKAFATGFIQDRDAVARDPDLVSLADEPRFQALVRPN